MADGRLFSTKGRQRSDLMLFSPLGIRAEREKLGEDFLKLYYGVESEDRRGLGARRVFDFAQAHFLADELREFFRAGFRCVKADLAPGGR